MHGETGHHNFHRYSQTVCFHHIRLCYRGSLTDNYSHDLKPEGDKAPALEVSNTSKSVLEEFNEKFQREANEYDKDILKRNYDLNTTLIFVSDS